MSNSITISKETIDLIKNFATINNSIAFKQGHRIRTMNVAETVFGDIHVPEEFPCDFSIAEVNKLIGVFNLPALRNEEIKLTFDDDHLLIQGGRVTVRYRYTDRSFATPPDLEFELDNIDFQVELSEEDVNSFIRSSQSLGLKVVEFVIDDGNISITATDPDLGEESNDYRLDLGKDDNGFEDCHARILLELLPLYSGSYKITIDNEGLAEFRCTTEGVDLVYHIGVEQDL